MGINSGVKVPPPAPTPRRREESTNNADATSEGGCDPATKAANHGAAALIDFGQGQMGRDGRACTAWLAGTGAWSSLGIALALAGRRLEACCQATGLEEPCREWTVSSG